MAWSKSSRIITLLVIDTVFFFIELTVGMFVAHSLALVADAFHMLNDVLSLCVGLWAVQKAQSNNADPKVYTYGFQRAETLGALINGVFLVALCVTIFLDAIGRFVEPVEVTYPVTILIVGCAGLASNLVGLLLFHDHSHGHGGHSHGHSHGGSNPTRDAEEGHAGHDHSHESHGSHAHASGSGHVHHTIEHTDTEASGSTIIAEEAPLKIVNPYRNKRRTSKSHSKSFLDFSGPRDFRHSIVEQAHRIGTIESEDGSDVEQAVDAEEAEEHDDIRSPLLGHATGKGYGTDSHANQHDHGSHDHAGAGHSHSDLNMRGIFLHVMGDALGNIGVIGTALFIWLTDFSWRFYADPAISLLITVIILCSAWPLCKAASRILLQAVPSSINLENIERKINSLPGVRKCHDLHIWQLSDTKMVASLHVKVDFSLKDDGAVRYMALAEDINECLHAWNIHSSTIQPEFPNDLIAHFQKDGSVGTSPTLAEEPGCLLDCVEHCGDGGKGCCPPVQHQEDSHQGHDHSH